MTEGDRKKLIAANLNLIHLQLSACNCLTKTDVAEYHSITCKYRLAKESADLICAVLKNTENKNGN